MKCKQWKTGILTMCLTICFVLLCLPLTGCLDDTSETASTSKTVSKTHQESFKKDDTWVIYWYLCGSDLESDGAAATMDLKELKKVTLPKNVKLIIQTGGASYWDNDYVNPDKLTRFEYSGKKLKKLEEKKLANMGSANTFTDFLKFCDKTAPADHRMLLFWNHGGGSIAGSEYDENFNYDSLTLSEMKKSLNAVFGSAKPFEVVGFDTCLMATLETANTFKDYANYLVASEETEPGCGWDYTKWVGSLAKNPAQNGAELGRNICDSFKSFYKGTGEAETLTLSVTDLNKIPALSEAFDAMGKELLKSAYSSQEIATKYSRSAAKAESYGGNNASEGYTNMVDLGDLVKKSQKLIPASSAKLQTALKDAVVYKINGKYRKNSNGISVYYSLNSDKKEIKSYSNVSLSKPYQYLMQYIAGSKIPTDAPEVSGLNADMIHALSSFGDTISLTVDKDGYAKFTLNKEQLKKVKQVTASLNYYSKEDDVLLCLGEDNDINADYDKGIFKDNFQGLWMGLDGNLAYALITYADDEYNLYSVPIKLNGKRYTLIVAYDYESDAYYILGAKKGVAVKGDVPSKGMVDLKDGDKIQMILYGSSMSGDDDPVEVPMDKFTYHSDMEIKDMDLPDGNYYLFFNVEDTSGKTTSSDLAHMKLKKGNITTEIEK